MNYIIEAKVSQEWLDVLGIITRHQDGFVWSKVEDNND